MFEQIFDGGARVGNAERTFSRDQSGAHVGNRRQAPLVRGEVGELEMQG